jgi:hypothetical protein
MKKLIIFAAIALLATVSINSANYITFGDSVRIKPACLDGYYHQPLAMTIDAYCDLWSLDLTYPDGLSVKLVNGVVPLAGMTVGYLDNDGSYQTLDAVWSVSAAYATLEARTRVPALWGYYDYRGDGVYMPYGVPKWEPGEYQVVEFNFYVDPDFRGGYVTMDELFDCGGDTRGPVLSNVSVFRKSYFWVGYMAGDVTGNERLDISDVTELIDRVLGKTKLDEFSEAAADANRDGVVDIDDVTIITKKILG